MDTPDLTALLDECLQLAGTPITVGSHQLSRDELPAELETLLRQAVEMRWPFVEEKWQYKSLVSTEDKVNTRELISQHLPQLMVLLKAWIKGAEPVWAMSVVFLMDRFLYWKDSSHTLLKIAKVLHRRYPETPVAPQVVIRQARVYLNIGKLQKAEYILSSLINNKGATGCWKYQKDSDQTLVQAVSLQVRGQVLQKLGLWLEAAELIWASLIGFCVLPLPDKKGIGTSLGLLASMLISMNDHDFATFQKRPHINLGFLGDCRHRLLCAAQAAKAAVVYSQFDALYVLTHMVTRGTCLLSYSFSRECPAAEKLAYLALAKEAFENGLITKKEKDTVTSQQELHTLIKAAYCLAITYKWMLGPCEQVTKAVHTCQEASALLYSYCFKEDSDKGLVSSEVMAKLQQVKALLKVKDFSHSDPGSFIPDSYQATENIPAVFTLDDFTTMIDHFQKHHQSVCEAFKSRGSERATTTHASCLTAFQTTLAAEPLTTECSTRGLGKDNANKNISDSSGSKGFLDSSNKVFQKETFDVTLDKNELQLKLKSTVKSEVQGARTSQGSSSFSSSWPDTPSSGASFVLVDPFCCTETDEDQARGEKISHKLQCKGTNSRSSHLSSQLGDNYQSILPSSHCAGDMNKGVKAQELCTTLESEDRETTNKGATNATDTSKETRMSVGSLGSSLGSSWQSVSFARSPPNEGGLSKTLKGCHPQMHVQNVQSSIKAVKDLDLVLSSSDGLSGLVMSKDSSIGPNAQQQPKQELCTTLESENHEANNKMATNATGTIQDTRTSSGSFSSSLGSSWQSASFSRSPPVDTNCGMDKGCPDSPFQAVKPNYSATTEGFTKTLNTSQPQTQLGIQSSIKTVEDLGVLSLADDLSCHVVAGNGPNGLKAQQLSKQELCTTLESEDSKTTNKIATNAPGKSQDTRKSSSSLSSSLGSSWQSALFSRSPPVDPNCGTDEVCPDSPFEVVKPNYSATAEGLTNTVKADHPRTQVGIQSSIHMVEDLDLVLSVSDGLSGLVMTKDGQNGLSAQQQAKQELCTTFESEDHEANNKMATNYTRKSRDIRTPSGSLSSSLGSSWQSFSLSRSPKGDFVEILNNKSAVDQNSETGNVDALADLAMADNGPNAKQLIAEHSSLKMQEGPLLLPTEFDSFVMVPSDQSKHSLTKKRTTPSSSANQGKSVSPEDSSVIAHLRKTATEDSPSCSKLEEDVSQFPSYMTCSRCFQGCMMGSVVVTEQDYRSLLSGVCQGCLLRRLPDQTFKLSQFSRAYSAVLLKYSKASESWTGSETSVYVGEVLQVAVEGRQRQAFRIQYLHQEQLLGSYVGKEYLKGRKPHAHLADVERQMTAQYYVMEFNKRLYEKNITTQIFYIPSELLLITEADCIVAAVSVEPYMLGDFVKLTNNTTKINKRLKATEYGIALGHFTYAFSNRQEVVVDLQGWVTANGKGLAYLTDPQIHSLRKPKSPSNFHRNGIIKFLQEQHGEHCGPICQAALHTFPQYLL